ncbi:MAG: NAD(P)H-dependent flavin oxidoreductase [Terriglobales bacterium]
MAAARNLFGIELPILQAPMAGSQASALALAVSSAGGLGALPAALLGTDALGQELAALRASGLPYNVNFFCHRPPAPDPESERAWRVCLAPYYQEFGVSAPASVGAARRPFDRELAELLAEFRPPVVSFHFGLPAPDLLARARAWGALVLSSATTVAEARWLEAHGVDAVIAQGLEAGGHRGLFLTDDLTTQLGTLALVPQIVQAVRVPVIAAGGIADARGVAAALALGAVAAQVGTAYLLSPEAATSQVHRAALASEAAAQTAVTRLFSGRPARGIVNRLMRELGPMHPAAPAFPLASAALAPLRAKAEAAGDGSFTGLWCGQNASGCRPLPAAVLTRQLAGLG